jgi:asparagine synthase (glutamine-hydrolysing)
MNATVAHRGPDDSGEYCDEKAGVALAMRRLKILDLSGGRQPMCNEDGSLWIVYNGEIYNSPELRRELSDRGHVFSTDHSDTEVLLHLYEEKQENMLESLNGMFAFVLFDKGRQRLFGARDRIGIKPLYYLKRPDCFVFGSELKSFLGLPFFEREIDQNSLSHYMSLLYIPGDVSILKGVHRLRPGHWFEYDIPKSRLKIEKYWNLTANRREARSEEEWCEDIRNALSRSVQQRMLSDVPVGISLSGGIDSSALVGLLADSGRTDIKTYSLGFTGLGEEDWDELPIARQVANRYGTEHHELILDPDTLLNDLIPMVWYLDEPYGGGLPSWFVFRFMSEEVKVGLTGTGGDELFGGYGKYLALGARGLERRISVRKDRVDKGRHFLSRLKGKSDLLFGGGPTSGLHDERQWVLNGIGRREFDARWNHFYAKYYYLSDARKDRYVLQTSTDGVPNTQGMLREIFEESTDPDVRNAMAYVDFNTQLPDEFLFFTDRLSMAHSLEARVPFLDHTLVEAAFGIPPSIRMRAHDLKCLLKKAVGDLLPREVLGARKRGFVIPIPLWLRGTLRPLVERLLSPERLGKQGIFRADFYHRFVHPHLEGKADFGIQVWAALMFQLWYTVFIDGDPTQRPTYSWRDII